MNEYDAKNAAHIHPHVHSHVPEEPALRVKALETLLVEKGLLDSAAVDAWIEVYSDEIEPKVGAKVVARAWCDDGFRSRLLSDGTATIKEMKLELPTTCPILLGVRRILLNRNVKCRGQLLILEIYLLK